MFNYLSNSFSTLRNNLLQYGGMSFCTVLLLVLNIQNEVPVNVGDGLAHFFIAQQVWFDPFALLDHWGKPLFTLLASPFAYFGFKWFVVFNIAVYFSTCLVANLIVRTLKLAPILSFIFPFVLLAVPDYTSTVLGGLTEPFFNFLLFLIGYALIKQKWSAIALITSLLPFCRSEGQLVIVLVAGIFIYLKQWKWIPFLASTWLIYAIIGSVTLNDFFWYFNNNPYQGASDIYGKGTWTHYFDLYPFHFGTIGVVILVLTLIKLLFYKCFNSISSTVRLLIFFSVLVYFGIFFSHAYLWANGQKGAFGLSRLVTQGLPSFLFVCLLSLFTLEKQKFTYYLHVVLSCFLIILTFNAFKKQDYPKKLGAFEKTIQNASDYLMEIQDDVPRIYYYHPLIAYYTSSNLKNTTLKFNQHNFGKIEDELQHFKGGELIVRDAHFGPMEMGLPKSNLGSLKRIQRFSAMTSLQTHLGEYYGVDVYQYQPNSTSISQDTIRLDEYSEKKQIAIQKNTEYTPVGTIDSTVFSNNHETIVSISSQSDCLFSNTFLVLQNQETFQNFTIPLNSSIRTTVSLPSDSHTYLIFIHNPNGEECKQVEIHVDVFAVPYYKLISSKK
jgi:hypothetical protein